MRELKITVSKILGKCTAHPPMKKGEYFTIRNGDIRIPKGGAICLWAMQNLLPLIPAKERNICEAKEEDWMWRVKHLQCPDPDGRVIFRIDPIQDSPEPLPKHSSPEPGSIFLSESHSPIKDLKIVVTEVRGHCTSGMKIGDFFLLRKGKIFIPEEKHFCLYALQSVLPFLAAKQRSLSPGDWLHDADHFICPDPAGNVILRVAPFSPSSVER